MVKKQDLQESGKVCYYGLSFEIKGIKEAEEYSVKNGTYFDYLGFDEFDQYIKCGVDDILEHLAVMWFRFNEPSNAGDIEDYFDGNFERVNNPLGRDQNKELFRKYDKHLFFMQFL